ncbi:MAG: Lactoylglutathione lyase [Lentisphaerae bacterium ADurb.BinA184]|nr:MAG: Lactoylglutathione lyase [Lentisphaerae bacterium ADurb.BinA184]
MIRDLAHVCFTVRSLAKSVDFYCHRLGLPKAFEFKRPDGTVFGVYLKVGPRSFIELFEGDPAAVTGGSYAHLCLEVDDVARTVAEWRARGVEVSDPALGCDHSWQAWLADPDGNRMELHGYTSESWQAPHLT